MSDADTKHLVVIGSSAGGIEALTVLLGNLPDHFAAPIVLAQHLDPRRPSQLAGILERRTRAQVVAVNDDTTLENGKVYVVPSNRDVVIRDGTVALTNHSDGRPRPSVDRLLSSAARVYGERLIAVILTGSGSDGAAGALDVKEAGGTVIIQDPRTAAHPSMPLALPPTAVDHVAELESMGSLMSDLLAGVSLPEHSPPADVLTEVLTRVSRHSSIDFRQYKPNTIVRRIGRRMAIHHLRTLEEYESYLEANPDEVGDLARSLLIKVTEFFRDTEAFDFMQKDILPTLIERGRHHGRTLRLWSAGCATGEEAYSLALLVSNALGAELPDWKIKIFATDVDGEAIAYARRGYYAANVIEALPEEYWNHYFERSDHGYRVSKGLRQMVIFGQQDLARGAPFPRIDLVVCRNLLIYFKPELQQEVLDRVAYSLHQTQGYLFLGKAEAARPAKAMYELVNKRWRVYRCVAGPLPMPAASAHEGARRVRTPAPATRSMAQSFDDQVAEGGPIDLTLIRRTNELMLRHLPIAVAVIDRAYRIISLNGAARRLLGIRDHGVDQDFLHSVRGLPYQEVRDTIDRMFREQSVATLGELDLGSGGAGDRHLNLQVVPLYIEGGALDFGMVCVADVTELVDARRRVEDVQGEQKRLTDELGAMNWRLTAVNTELQDANEELQAGNEEMMLAQEELQATNEEFEATNEELQATNEELETNNEELQATNEELETTNEELQARTSELQELTRALTGERQRFGTILQHAPLQSALLRGPSLLVEEMHPALAWLFGPAQTSTTSFAGLPLDPALEPLRAGVQRALADNQIWVSPHTRVKIGDDDHWYMFKAVPIASDGTPDGVVLYVEEVSERRRLEQEERLGKIRVMLEHADQVAMALFELPDGRLVDASRRFVSLLEARGGRVQDVTGGHTWQQLWPGDDESRAAFDEVVASGQARRLREVRLPADDSVWDFSLIPIGKEDGGETRHVVVSGVEVTDAVRSRERLERLDLLKDEFLSLASHELRTPLAPLATYSEVLARLLDEQPRNPEWEQQLRHIVDSFRRQVQQMSRLTDDLLDVARLQSGKFTLQLRTVDLRRIVEDAVERARALDGPPIVLKIDAAKKLEITADEVRLGQAIHNLLANARAHASESPHLDVLVGTNERGAGRVARVSVRDYGSGVPAAARAMLFTRFFQSTSGERPSRSGLGLGLYISRQIVEQHGGRIGMEHEQPGSTFWIEIPLKER